MKKHIPTLFLGAALLGGCTNAQRPLAADPVMIKIQDSAAEIKRGVIQLEQIKQAMNTIKVKHYRTPKFGPLTKRVTLKWAGNTEKAVTAIAEMIGYQVTRSGTRPLSPVIVVIDTINQPAFSVLEDIGWQAGASVGISVNEDKRSIMIVYKGD